MAGPWERYQQQTPSAPAQGPWQRYQETAPAVPAPTAGSDPGWLAALGQGVAQGITFGFGDEIMAGLKTGGGLWGDYGKELHGQRQAIADAERAHPVWFGAGNVAGALPTVAIPGLGAIRAATLPGKITGSVATGLGTGALVGAGTANGDLADRAKSALAGAGIGVLGGLVALPLGAAIGAGLGKAAQWVSGRGITPAERRVAGAIERDAVSNAPNTPDAMLADAGPNLQRQAAAIYAMPGPGQGVIRNALAQRAAGASQRVTKALDAAFGAQKNLPATVQQLMQQRSAAASPLYARAYATQMPWKGAFEFSATPVGRIVTGTPAGRAAFKDAQRLAKNEGVRIDLDHMDIRALDYVKQALDDQITTLQRSGANKQAAAVTRLRDLLLFDADRISPDYAAARAAWAGPSAIKDAVEAGQSAFARAISPDELAQELSRLSPSERDGYVLGARAAVSQIMGTARNDAAAAFRELGQKGWNREKLGLLLGQQQADDLLRSLDAERAYQATAQGVMGNSETAARASAIKDFSTPGGNPAGAAAGYVNGGIMGLLRSMGLSMGSAGINAVQGKEMERLAAEAAQVLTATGAKRQALESTLRAHIARVNGTANLSRRADLTTRAFVGAGVNTQIIPRFTTGPRF